jgi:hypothetical protein
MLVENFVDSDPIKRIERGLYRTVQKDYHCKLCHRSIKTYNMNFDCCKNCRRGGEGYEEKGAIMMTIQNGSIEAKSAAVPEVAKLLPLPASLVSITTSTSLCSRCCHYQSLATIASIPSDYATFLQQVFIFFIKFT